ncbi:hypothetical protein H5410_055128 [Solanum commersonii]|uniref:Uncharacterized protein n=1 Tax=Solanum commersonii TaxID=4109 RepID=A0A9J5WHC8_SOLCO|nr:hypothetical protein H5410_055128 [Solanum commersonii]
MWPCISGGSYQPSVGPDDQKAAIIAPRQKSKLPCTILLTLSIDSLAPLGYLEKEGTTNALNNIPILRVRRPYPTFSGPLDQENGFQSTDNKKVEAATYSKETEKYPLLLVSEYTEHPSYRQNQPLKRLPGGGKDQLRENGSEAGSQNLEGIEAQLVTLLDHQELETLPL